MRVHTFRQSRFGFTLVELMITVFIGGVIILLLVFLFAKGCGVPYLKSQEIRTSDASAWLMNELKCEEVIPMEEYRTDPQGKVGCYESELIGLKMMADGEVYWMCCGSGIPMCRIIDTPDAY